MSNDNDNKPKVVPFNVMAKPGEMTPDEIGQTLRQRVEQALAGAIQETGAMGGYIALCNPDGETVIDMLGSLPDADGSMNPDRQDQVLAMVEGALKEVRENIDNDKGSAHFVPSPTNPTKQ